MENNCLVTTFNANTGNQSLPIFGDFVFNVKAGNTVTFGLGSYPLKLSIIVDGEGHLKNAGGTDFGTQYDHPGGAWGGPTKIITTGDCKVSITDNFKYTFDYLVITANANGSVIIDPDMLIYNDPQPRNRVAIYLTNVDLASSLDLSKLSDYTYAMSFVNVKLAGNSRADNQDIFSGMLSAKAVYNMINTGGRGLANATLFDGASTVEQVSVPLIGDIKYLADTKTATYGITARNYLHGGSVNNTWTEGSLEELAARAVGLGKAPGNIRLEWLKYFKNVTLDGTPLSEHTEIDNTDDSFVNWDAQGEISISYGSPD